MITEFKCNILHEKRAENGNYQMFLLKNGMAQSLNAVILQLNTVIRFELILTEKVHEWHHADDVYRVPA